MLENLFLVLLGVALLTVGGEALIRGAMATARRLNVSPLLCGLVIVGFGTSAPELAVSVDAATQQLPDLATGNVVGSNIGNILLILGLCALITPLNVRPLILRRDSATALAASVFFVVLSLDGLLSRTDAVILFSCLLGYVFWAYRTETLQNAPSGSLHEAEEAELSAIPRRTLWIALFILIGLLLLFTGSKSLLAGAIGIARHFGLSETVIGLTLIAVGTSLPELSISVIAAIRRHADVAIGNVLGSNIFNIFGILGVSAMLQPLTISSRLTEVDQWVLLASSLLVVVFLLTSRQIKRWEGAILLTGYILYCYSALVFTAG